MVFCKIENLDQKSEDLDTEEAEDKTSGAWLFTSIVGSALLLPSAVLLANSRRCRRSHRHPFT